MNIQSKEYPHPEDCDGWMLHLCRYPDDINAFNNKHLLSPVHWHILLIRNPKLASEYNWAKLSISQRAHLLSLHPELYNLHLLFV